jgi:hypothetical protein
MSRRVDFKMKGKGNEKNRCLRPVFNISTEIKVEVSSLVDD